MVEAGSIDYSLQKDIMPTLLSVKGYRFFFYSNENNEPMHVHILRKEMQIVRFGRNRL